MKRGIMSHIPVTDKSIPSADQVLEMLGQDVRYV